MTENIQNLGTYDPFADTGESDKLESTGNIHIRIQQRQGRKTITTVQGLPSDIDQKRLLKAFKKEFGCIGNIVQDDEMGQVIQMSGDQRQKTVAFLTTEEIATKDKIKVHGF
ncbi:translation initiation factor SUI1 [Globomyces pollinis-pini]|nr:translation initiation factor SUI1 [Globomyces pollinis-pini]